MKSERHATRPNACGDDPVALDAGSRRPRGPRRLRANRRRNVLHALGLALLICTSLASGGCAPASFGPVAIPFDRARWVAEPHSHAAMAEDLIANHLRPGMPKQEVVDLLGLDASDIGRNLSEDMGGWGACCYLEIEFDELDLLVQAYLNPY